MLPITSITNNNNNVITNIDGICVLKNILVALMKFVTKYIEMIIYSVSQL